MSLRESALSADTPRIRSPLRYPGGKSRAVSQILGLIPPDIDRLCSPFIGGGSIELACVAKGIRVFGYDAFDPLVNFWCELLKDPLKVAQVVVEKYHPLTRSKFYALQKRYAGLEDRRRMAAAFFALNRSSFSGTTLSGGMSPGHPRFNDTAVERLANFHAKGLSVRMLDFSESIDQHKDDFLYLDPPYANGGKLYGKQGDMHNGFDHALLAKKLRRRKGWLLSYNDCGMVRELYKGFEFVQPQWAYGMSSRKQSSEVLILSKDYQ